jgi:hypothetical protein
MDFLCLIAAIRHVEQHKSGRDGESGMLAGLMVMAVDEGGGYVG